MSNNYQILYSFRRCPYAMRARFALAYSNIKCEVREVDLKNKPSELLEISPKGTVPVLLLRGGEIIDESVDIINYAININDPDGWSNFDCDDIKSIIDKNDNEFAPSLRKYKYHDRYEESQGFYLKKAEEAFLIFLEEQLQKNPYVLGSAMSIADVAIFPFIRQFAMVNQAWFDQSSYINIKRWLDIFLNNPIYAKIMEKHSPYRAS